jgi:hypothetical protein
MGLLLRKAAEVVWPTNYFYRPEKHYMRGPGPKSLSLIGEGLRAEAQSFTQEPLPQRLLDLIHDLDEREQQRAGHREPAADRAVSSASRELSISGDGQDVTRECDCGTAQLGRRQI